MGTFFIFCGFLLGLTIFLLGLRLMAESLSSIFGFRLKVLLSKLTRTKTRSLIIGALCTAFVQSSSAVAATMVVLVDSGVLGLKQAFAIILGANIGTTLTAQIMAFSLGNLVFPLIIFGLLVIYLFRIPQLGQSLVGLGAIFFGLSLVTTSLVPLLNYPFALKTIFYLTKTPLTAVVAGCFLTALVQSSSAVTGLVISLSNLGAISLTSAIALALGSNIGTVITSLVASLGRSRASRATAIADLIFNLAGVILVLPIYKIFLGIISLTSQDKGRQVANAHTLFNLFTALLALPFLDYLVQLAWFGAGIRVRNKNNKD